VTFIGFDWDPMTLRGDWSRNADGGLAAGDPLHSAVMVSLFTDRRAGPDDVLTDGSTDRRGWWGDAYAESRIGSRLWLLRRRKRDAETLRLAEDAAREALLWMIRDGVAARIDVSASWADRDRLLIDITISRSDGAVSALSASWAWSV